MSGPTLTRSATEAEATIVAGGPWTGAHVASLERLVQAISIEKQPANRVAIDISRIEQLDTLGAWLLERLMRRCQLELQETALVGVPAHFRGLLDKVHNANRAAATPQAKTNRIIVWLERLGRATIGFRDAADSFLDMLGAIGISLIRAVRWPQTLRITSVVHYLYRVAWQAVPIITLITFLIGGIIAQQGIFHFRKFGADAYVVDMVGILVLREIGVLIVSIMVAGRSGSAYTAELGSMKMREEIDALRTMGFDPVEVLILPRVLALVIALPILTFLGSMAALYGGGLVAWLYGGMSP
ncbi:MAG TPA: ABC transporter permease, partial [Anaerolineae bacterium]